jgi:hypothetical protein
MPPAFSLSAGKSVLRVQTIAGDEKTINADANTQIVSVASWCPHSHSFVRAISDPRVKRELRHKKWVFIMEADEWPAVRRQLDELASDPTYHGPSPADQVRRLKERAGGGGVFDPGFLDTLPGDLYFFPTSFLQSDPPLAFPSLYSASTGKFEGHAASSLPKSVRDLYHKYDAEN